MITKDTLVQVTILVPMGDIEIIDSKVSYTKTDPQDPWDIQYNGILIECIDYEIMDFQDGIIDDKLKQDWEES